MSPRARTRWIVGGLVGLLVAGAVLLLRMQPSLDLTPHAERLLKAEEVEAQVLLNETALAGAWSVHDLRAALRWRLGQLGPFQGFESVEPLERSEEGNRPRRKLTARVRFAKSPTPVTCRFDFVHRPGGWALADFDVPLPQLTQGPAAPEKARVEAEEIARLVLSRRLAEVHRRLGRREQRAETAAALEQRVMPLLAGLGRVASAEALEAESIPPRVRVPVRLKDVEGHGCEVVLELEFELGRWVVRRLDVSR